MFPALVELGYKRFLVLVVCVCFGVFFRFWQLDQRPLHHDESIHAQLAFNFFKNPQNDYYRYDPVYHGPTFYLVLRYFYMFSDYSSDATPRIPVVIVSLLVLIVIWLAREIFDSKERFFILCGLLLSPCLIFYSRFAREDWFVILGFCLSALGLAKKNMLWTSLGVALQVVTKANFYIHAGLAFAFVSYAWIRGAFKAGFKFREMVSKRALIGLSIGLLVFMYISTTEFRNWAGAYEVFSKSLTHWWEMHKIERIAGPFSYHLTVMALYEQPLFLLILAACVHFVFASSLKPIEKAGLFAALIFVPIFLGQSIGGRTNYEVITDTRLGKFLVDILKLKGPVDLTTALYIFGFGFVFTERYLKKDFKLSAVAFSFFSTLFAYSYAGEKVPWLGVYPLLTGYVFAACYWVRRGLSELIFSLFIVLLSFVLVFCLLEADKAIIPKPGHGVELVVVKQLILLVVLFMSGFLIEAMRKKAKIEFSFLFTAVVAISIFVLLNLRVNFSLRAREITMLSQVHTSFHLRDLAQKLIQGVENNPLGRPLRIGYSGDATWPLAWYFKEKSNFVFFIESDDIPSLNLDCVFIDEGKDVSQFGFSVMKIPIRSWVIYDLNQSNWREFLNFFKFGDNLPGFGSSYTKFGCKTGVIF